MNIAVIHDWLVTYAGAERVLEQILTLYPQADLYSLIDIIPEENRVFILNKTVRTSFIQQLPFARKRYRSYLPLMPKAIERFNLSRYDLIISSSHAVAKGVTTHKSQAHICYCHTPMRYIWDLSEQYLRAARLDKGIRRAATVVLLDYLRKWDMRSASRVNYFIANSQYIAERIIRIYGRDSEVVYPPVDIDKFSVGTKKEDFYLAVSRMVPYKRIDLIVDAFAGLPDKRLVLIGDGPEYRKIKSKAGCNVLLLGYQPFEVVHDYMKRARAFIFAAEEDFGIVVAEAQACGTPVIAYGKGGATEIVVKGETGSFFNQQTAASLISAIQEFERTNDSFDSSRIRRNAERFGLQRFRTDFRACVERALVEHGAD